MMVLVVNGKGTRNPNAGYVGFLYLGSCSWLRV